MKRALLLAAVCLIAVTIASAQQMQMPTPSPEVKKLSYFEGTWSLTGDMKPNAFGPGGKMTETEKNQWMDGGFFLKCEVSFSSDTMGKGTGLSFMGWDPESKMSSPKACSSISATLTASLRFWRSRKRLFQMELGQGRSLSGDVYIEYASFYLAPGF